MDPGIFFIGRGVKSVIVWITKPSGSDEYCILSVSSDQAPFQVQISKYQDVLQEIDWDEGKAKLEMK
jgi:hypothetical protein